MVELVDMAFQRAEMHQVAILPRIADQKFDRVLPEAPAGQQAWEQARTWGVCGSRRCADLWRRVHCLHATGEQRPRVPVPVLRLMPYCVGQTTDRAGAEGR